MNLKDKELKSIVTTNIGFDSEEIFGIKGQLVYLKKDVKQSVLDLLRLHFVDYVWEEEDRIYFKEKYNINPCDEQDVRIRKIFGDFEK